MIVLLRVKTPSLTMTESSTLHDFTHFNSVGLWYGRLLKDNTNKENFSWSVPHFELENPWAKTKGYSDSRLIEIFGEVPWENPKQSYDFRPKKGSYLIDSGVIIPGINDGKDEKDEKVFLETEKPGYLNSQWRRRADTEDCTILHHPQSFSGQNRKYIGSAPDIGAYEYGDSSLLDPGISGTQILVFPFPMMEQRTFP